MSYGARENYITESPFILTSPNRKPGSENGVGYGYTSWGRDISQYCSSPPWMYTRGSDAVYRAPEGILHPPPLPPTRAVV